MGRINIKLIKIFILYKETLNTTNSYNTDYNFIFNYFSLPNEFLET